MGPVVCRVAEQGGGTVQAIVGSCVDELAARVRTLLTRLGPWSERPTLGLVGGMVGEGGPLRDELLRALDGLQMDVLDRAVVPARGAALLALSLLGR